MGTPSLVRPDLGLGVHGVPSDDGAFALWDQASSPAGRASASLGMDTSSRSQRETHRHNFSQEGDIRAWEATWAQVKKFSVPIVTGASESDHAAH